MQHNKSNILTVLENLERMFQCYRYSTNSISGKIQSLALAVEARSLAAKIRLASERWTYKLPFKEACDVDFSVWSKKVERWIQVLSNDELFPEEEEVSFFTPNTDYYIDQFYHVRDEIDQVFENGSDNPRFFEIADIEIYNQKFNDFKEEFDCDWLEYSEEIDITVINDFESDPTITEDSDIWLQQIAGKREQEVIATLRHIHEDNNFSDTCVKALKSLSEALQGAYRILWVPQEEAYQVLFKRLSVTYFHDSIIGAIESFRRWRSFAPTVRRLQAFEEKFEKEKGKFFSGKWKEGLEAYFDTDNIERFVEGTDAGKFIYKYRCELSKEEVGHILTGCHKLACYYGEICKLREEEKQQSLHPSESTFSPKIDIGIPLIFTTALRHHSHAARLLVETLRECEHSVGKRNGKSWGHVKAALIQLGFIDHNCTGSDFGTAIEQLCLGQKAKNVEQTLKRYNSRNPRTIDIHKEQGIIELFIEQFNPIKLMMCK